MKTQFQDSKIPLFDLHCDTLSEIYKKKTDLSDISLHISLEKASGFSPYIQIGAIWSDYRYDNDTAYSFYKKCLNYINKQKIPLTTVLPTSALPCFVLAIEDARLLNNDLNRLYSLYYDGVRVITLNWRGNSCIGGGWDTDYGLSDFGFNVVKACYEKGITVDLSHSSLLTQKDVLNLAVKLGFTPIFSHSNSYYVCKHNRNLKDEIFKEIVSLGGIVGISLCPEHLDNIKQADFYSIIKHVHHYLHLNGERNISLGCDFDGIASLPTGFKSIKDLESLYSLFLIEFGPKITNKIFFYNAYSFFEKHLKGGR